MKHLSWKYRKRRTPREQREFRAAQSKRINRRWEKQRESMAWEPVRQTRVTRITIVDSHRPSLVIEARREPTPKGWGLAVVTENGKAVSGKWGRVALAKAIASIMA
jgi:hypothetical protein